MNIVCSGPGPHVPASGIIGTSDKPIPDARCSSPSCTSAPDPIQVNRDAVVSRAQAALTANATFLAIPTANLTNPQVIAQVQRLTKESNAFIRILLGLYADVSDTA